MDRGEPIAEVRAEQGYDGLHQALRARADALQISREAIEELAGLTRGHAGKLLAPYPVRALGRTTLGPVMYALKLKILIVPDDDVVWREQPNQRAESYAKNAVTGKPLTIGMGNMQEVRAIRRKVLTETLKKNGRKGGRKSAALRMSKSPEERARIIKRGWRTRRKMQREQQEALRRQLEERAQQIARDIENASASPQTPQKKSP